MKCAAELLSLKEEYEVRKIIEEKIKKEKQKEKNSILELETVRYCEEVIGKRLETKAKSGQEIATIQVGIIESDCVNRKHFFFLEEEGRRYRDGKKSFVPSKKSILMDTLEDYLKSFCLKVQYEEYEFYSYGLGKCKATKIVVTI